MGFLFWYILKYDLWLKFVFWVRLEGENYIIFFYYVNVNLMGFLNIIFKCVCLYIIIFYFEYIFLYGMI